MAIGFGLGSRLGFIINILPSAWRTWLAQFMSYGLIQMSGIFYAQIADPSSTAMYLFSLCMYQFFACACRQRILSFNT